MTSTWLATAALAGATGVALGAFAAHGLKARLSADLIAVFETGVRYHMYHALALVGVAWAASRWPSAWVTAAGGLFVAGIVVFSGSLYLLAITGVRGLGAITPLGGVCFILGWVSLAVAALRGS